MINLSFINRKETDKELAHEDVYEDKILYLGYIIKDNPKVGNILAWHFVSKSTLPNLKAETRDKLINLLYNENTN